MTTTLSSQEQTIRLVGNRIIRETVNRQDLGEQRTVLSDYLSSLTNNTSESFTPIHSYCPKLLTQVPSGSLATPDGTRTETAETPGYLYASSETNLQYALWPIQWYPLKGSFVEFTADELRNEDSTKFQSAIPNNISRWAYNKLPSLMEQAEIPSILFPQCGETAFSIQRKAWYRLPPNTYLTFTYFQNQYRGETNETQIGVNPNSLGLTTLMKENNGEIQVYAPNVPNVYEDGAFCLGDSEDAEAVWCRNTLRDWLDTFSEFFYSASFNYDLLLRPQGYKTLLINPATLASFKIQTGLYHSSMIDTVAHEYRRLSPTHSIVRFHKGIIDKSHKFPDCGKPPYLDLTSTSITANHRRLQQFISAEIPQQTNPIEA